MNQSSYFSACPVIPRPNEDIDLRCIPCNADDGWEAVQDADVEAADWDRAIDATHGNIVDVDDDAVVLEVKPLPAPILPSKAQIEAHNLTHWPYRSRCPHCVAARRPDSHHRRSKSNVHRSIPLTVATIVSCAIWRIRDLPEYLS